MNSTKEKSYGIPLKRRRKACGIYTLESEGKCVAIHTLTSSYLLFFHMGSDARIGYELKRKKKRKKKEKKILKIRETSTCFCWIFCLWEEFLSISIFSSCAWQHSVAMVGGPLTPLPATVIFPFIHHPFPLRLSFLPSFSFS